jgi:hypothetical protein
MEMSNVALQDEEDVQVLRRICYSMLREIAQVRSELEKAQNEGEKSRKELAHFRMTLSKAVVDHGSGRFEKPNVRFSKLRKDVNCLLSGYR